MFYGSIQMYAKTLSFIIVSSRIYSQDSRSRYFTSAVLVGKMHSAARINVIEKSRAALGSGEWMPAANTKNTRISSVHSMFTGC